MPAVESPSSSSSQAAEADIEKALPRNDRGRFAAKVLRAIATLKLSLLTTST